MDAKVNAVIADCVANARFGSYSEMAGLLDDAERVNRGTPKCVIVEGIMFWADARPPMYCDGSEVDVEEARAVIDRYLAVMEKR